MTTTSEPTEAREVSPLELFYDLVFVFAVSQLSEHLLHDLTWRGAVETFVLLCVVLTVWLLTTFEATYFGITRRQTQAAVLGSLAEHHTQGVRSRPRNRWRFPWAQVGPTLSRQS